MFLFVEATPPLHPPLKFAFLPSPLPGRQRRHHREQGGHQPGGLPGCLLRVRAERGRKSGWFAVLGRTRHHPLSPSPSGLAQIMAAIFDMRRGSTFGATMFTAYGMYWLGFGLYTILGSIGVWDGTSHGGPGVHISSVRANQMMNSLYGLLTTIFFVATLRMNRASSPGPLLRPRHPLLPPRHRGHRAGRPKSLPGGGAWPCPPPRSTRGLPNYTTKSSAGRCYRWAW